MVGTLTPSTNALCRAGTRMFSSSAIWVLFNPLQLTANSIHHTIIIFPFKGFGSSGLHRAQAVC